MTTTDTVSENCMKSKEQKRREAIERDRYHYDKKSQRWRQEYANRTHNEHEFGKEWADTRWAEEDRAFKEYLKRAQLDSSGNPLE
jgi:hypothetical protein